ncbi:MAG: hypothetical protein CMM29_00560 [Rhodospirillaceae bacterium]|nr:hypothetical protein [Rhodospirillaceae bacterium]
MRYNYLKILAIDAVFTTLTTTATHLIRGRVPATQGYINLGDAVVIVPALLSGPRTDMIAGGIGSAVANGLGGYTH